jgi:hypothetical protein
MSTTPFEDLARAMREFPVVFADQIAEAMDRSGKLVEIEAKATTAFTDRTGNLRKSIQHEMIGSGSVVIWPGMEYGAHVEQGTVDESKVGQKIYPKNKRALSWPTANGSIVRRWSTIGRRKPRPFMAPALAAKQGEIIQIFADAVDLTLAKVGI